MKIVLLPSGDINLDAETGDEMTFFKQLVDASLLPSAGSNIFIRVGGDSIGTLLPAPKQPSTP